MLQLMTAPTQQGQASTEVILPGAGQPSADGLGFTLLGDALAALPVTDEAIDSSTALPVEPMPQVAIETTAQVPVEPVSEPLQSAEQWLLSVLGQREVKVQAREGEQETQTMDEQTADAAAVPLSAELLMCLPPPRLAEKAAGVETPQTTVQMLQQAPRADALGALLAGQGQAVEVVTANTASAGEALPVVDAAAPASLPDNNLLRGLGNAQAQADATPVLERQLKLHAPEAKWGEQMLGALRDSVELQLQQKVQSATIRLDPPELGSLEILLSHDSGRLNVQITAANGDVSRLLQQTSERLRQELVGQNFLQVNVQVGGDAQSGQQGQQHSRWRQQQDESVAQAQRLDSGEDGARRSAGDDVLITV